jgi:hypothetical protein
VSYTKDPRGYPPAFRSLIEAAHLREVRIPCANPADAKRLEGRLHAYFGVLHRTAAKDHEYLPLDNMARQIKIKAVDSTLVAIPRDLEPDNAMILAALGSQPPMPHAGEAPMSAEMAEMFHKSLTRPA